MYVNKNPNNNVRHVSLTHVIMLSLVMPSGLTRVNFRKKYSL